MITVTVKYTLPQSYSSEQVAVMLKAGAEKMFKNLPHLYSKQFCYDAEKNQGFSVYLWDTRASAEAFFNEQFMQNFKQSMHMPEMPLIEFHDTLVVVDNRKGDILF